MVFRDRDQLFYKSKYHRYMLAMREYELGDWGLFIHVLPGGRCAQYNAPMEKGSRNFIQVGYSSFCSLEEYPKDKMLRCFIFPSSLRTYPFNNFDECLDYEWVDDPGEYTIERGKIKNKQKSIPQEGCIIVPTTLENYSEFKRMLEERTGKEVVVKRKREVR